jgi:drug/metabolite transporter (DMT)-like permease
MAAFHLAYVAGTLPILLLAHRPILPTARREWRLLALAGATHVGTLLTQMLALQLTLVSYVIAIKRAGMLLSVVLGAVFFGERNLRRRLLGAALMSAGVALVLLGE